ncbi:Uncharacterised protein [Nocardia brasiliensis]|nr:Uncharacterised protein [Nocardia brasiliensis]
MRSSRCATTGSARPITKCRSRTRSVLAHRLWQVVGGAKAQKGCGAKEAGAAGRDAEWWPELSWLRHRELVPGRPRLVAAPGTRTTGLLVAEHWVGVVGGFQGGDFGFGEV